MIADLAAPALEWTVLETALLAKILFDEIHSKPYSQDSIDKLAVVFRALFNNRRAYGIGTLSFPIQRLLGHNFNDKNELSRYRRPCEYTKDELSVIWGLHIQKPDKSNQHIVDEMIEYAKTNRTHPNLKINLDQFFNKHSIAWLRLHLEVETTMGWSVKGENQVWELYTTGLFQDDGKTFRERRKRQRKYNDKTICEMMNSGEFYEGIEYTK